MSKWTAKVIEDENGELVLEFPEDLLKTMNWSVGTVLEWTDNKDGSWSIGKKMTSEEALDEMARINQELGLYDE